MYVLESGAVFFMQAIFYPLHTVIGSVYSKMTWGVPLDFRDVTGPVSRPLLA